MFAVAIDGPAGGESPAWPKRRRRNWVSSMWIQGRCTVQWRSIYWTMASIPADRAAVEAELPKN